MSDVIHVIKSPNDPAVAPQVIGQHWINTVAKRVWFSVGDTLVTDWILQANDAYITDSTTISMAITVEDFLLGNAGGVITITLPDATTNDKPRAIKNSSAFDLIIDGLGAQTIDNDLTATLAGGTMSAVTLHSEGGNWWIT